MDSWITGVAQYGYPLLFLIVFLEAIGLPIPAAPALLIAGAASARGTLHPVLTVGGAITTMMFADTLLFLLGRHTGWWLLGLLCRISLNPDSCILRSAESFHRRGRTLLVFAKFIPGINTMAPPMAGSMKMRLPQFLRLDFCGAALYTGAYLSAGYIGSDVLGALTRGYQAFGQVLAWVLAAAAAAYIGAQAWMWKKARQWRSAPVVLPADAARAAADGTAVIFDVRSHGYYERNSVRIQGSRRLDPNALPQLDQAVLPTDKLVYLYCTCIRDATSARVALVLIEKGILCAVIQGGLSAWRKAGLPVEPIPLEEMAAMPVFDA